MIPFDINDIDENQLKDIFDVDTVKKVTDYIYTNGRFRRKQDIKNCIGSIIYNQLKDNFIINPPSRLLQIKDDKEFLTELSKFNNVESRNKIKKYIDKINPSIKNCGHNYVLRWSGDKYKKWYKVGETKRDPLVRASEWKYNLIDETFTSDRKTMERILHQHLNFAHSIRDAIHGKGKTEVEWFYLSKNMLMRTIKAVINIFDPYSFHFTMFQINKKEQLNKHYILKQYNQLVLKSKKNAKTLKKLVSSKVDLLDLTKDACVNQLIYSRPITLKTTQSNSECYDDAVKILVTYSLEQIMQISGCGGTGVYASHLHKGLRGTKNYTEFMKKEIRYFKEKKKHNVLNWIVHNDMHL